MASLEVRIARLEAALAKEHSYDFDEGDAVKSTHGEHVLPGVRLYVGTTLPATDSGYNMAFITSTSALNVLSGGAWHAIVG